MKWIMIEFRFDYLQINSKDIDTIVHLKIYVAVELYKQC